MAASFSRSVARLLNLQIRRVIRLSAGLGLVLSLSWLLASPSLAITAPELRGQKAVQDISPDMHGQDLKEKEFLKADLQGVNLSDSDLRGAVINTSLLQGANLQRADLGDVVAFASRFDGADLRDARLENAMLMQSRFNDAQIEGADFTNAVIDLPQLKALCGRAEGTNSVTGVSTRESLGCR
ncbi:MAG: pentapeptide repeat-containing protein [Synechococcus sp.]|nr:pentapeptide repeat-containing protein [Synechococcus sp.]